MVKRVRLAYGEEGLWIELPDGLDIEVVEPRFVPGLPDEREAILRALREPIGSPPLKELVRPDDTVVIVFSDITRPMPNARVLPVLLEELSHVPRSHIVLINALGTHRPQTEDELMEMLGGKLSRTTALSNMTAVTRSASSIWGNRASGTPSGSTGSTWNAPSRSSRASSSRTSSPASQGGRRPCCRA